MGECWKEVNLANAPLAILDGDRGKNYPSQDELQQSGDCLFLSAKNVRTSGFDFTECQFITSQKDAALGKGKLNRYDVVLTTRGTVGNVAYYDDGVEFECIRINSGMVIIRADSKELLSSFCYWMVVFLQPDFQTFSSGSAQPQLPIRDLKEIAVKLPPLPEQRAIASVLSSLDDKIDLLHRQNKTLEAMAETLFRQWFVEEAREDWEEANLGEVAELNFSSIDSSYQYEDILYLDTSSLTAGVFETPQVLSLNEAPSRARRLVKHNDILFSTVRPDQRHYGIVKNPAENLVVSTGFCVITATRVNPHFLYLLLTNDEMTEFLHSVAEGSTSTYPSLKPSDLGAIRFRNPPKARHAEFAEIANANWEKMTRNALEIRTLETLRDTLLPKLVSGEVRVRL